MSLKRNLIFIFLFVFLGLAAGYWMTQHQDRSPASTQLAAPELKTGPWAHTLVGKNNRLFDLLIVPASGVAEHDDQEVSLRAYITLLAPIDADLEYEWILPNGVVRVAGELTDSWSDIQPGQTATAEISLLGFSKSSKLIGPIVFRATASVNGQLLASSTAFGVEDFVKPAQGKEVIEQPRNSLQSPEPKPFDKHRN